MVSVLFVLDGDMMMMKIILDLELRRNKISKDESSFKGISQHGAKWT